MNLPALRRPEGESDVERQRRANSTTFRWVYAACVAFSVVVAAVLYGSYNQLFAPSGTVVLLGVAICVVRPVAGLYLTTALAMLGDASIFPSYPITKNFSSIESVLYLSDQLSLSPLDLFLAALFLGWVLQQLPRRSWQLRRGRLFVPILAFSGFVLVGMAWGLGRGGAAIVAYWEGRALLYLPALFLLTTNLFDRAEQFRRMWWLLLIVLTLNAFGALWEYYTLTPTERDALRSLGEHGAAVHWATLIVFTVATLLFRHRDRPRRWLLVAMSVPAAWALMLSERRAAMIGLFAGLALVLVVLRWHHSMRFRFAFPIAAVVAVVWLAAFWNADGPLSLPSEAAKAVIATGQQSEQDRASDLYRDLEEFNINSTIRANPITGVGFGQPFYMIVPLPDISFFPFWQYITHNSILWIWMKTGIGGFVAMLVMFATSMREGARALRASSDGAWTVATLASVAYVLMFAIFAYVDIAWDTRNVVLLAFALAQIDRARTLTAVRSTPPTNRELGEQSWVGRFGSPIDAGR